MVAGQGLSVGGGSELGVQLDELVTVDRLEQHVAERRRGETHVVVLAHQERESPCRADALDGVGAAEPGEDRGRRLVHRRDPAQRGTHRRRERQGALPHERADRPGRVGGQLPVDCRGDVVGQTGVATGLAVRPQRGVGRHARQRQHLDGVGPRQRLEVEAEQLQLARGDQPRDEAGLRGDLRRPDPHEDAQRAGAERA